MMAPSAEGQRASAARASIRLPTDHTEPDPNDSRLSEAEIAEVIAPLHEELLRVARRILRREDLAEDAVQEAVIAFWKGGRRPPNPSGWLIRAVVHRALHLHRTQCRRRHHEQLACCRRIEAIERSELSEGLERDEFLARLDGALDRLPASHREVFVLREVESLDYEGIAMLLNIPLGTVRSRLNRARAALQSVFRWEDLGTHPHPSALSSKPPRA